LAWEMQKGKGFWLKILDVCPSIGGASKYTRSTEENSPAKTELESKRDIARSNPYLPKV